MTCPTTVRLGFLGLMLVLGGNPAARAQPVFFDDTGPDLLRLGSTGQYEIAFRKTNGAVAHIRDLETGEAVSAGSNGEQLWTAFLPDHAPSFIGGGGYDVRYAWDAQTRTLRLEYLPAAGAPRLTAHVEVTASDARYLDMTITVQNDAGGDVMGVGFPSDLLFVVEDVEEALLPVMPGVILEPGFFAEGRSFTRQYPGWPGVFADFQQVQTRHGSLALYTLNPPTGSVPMVTLGFAQETWVAAGHTAMLHLFQTFIGDGETLTSPVVRVRVGETREATIAALRRDNEIDRLPDAREKLGPLFDRVSRSPLLKAELPALFEAHGLDRSQGFGAFHHLLPRLPSPALFHPLAFHEGGFDHNYPDFLNLDPALGSMDELAALVDQAHALGLLVMPYTNPTWWDETSPTVQRDLGPLGPADIALHHRDGSPFIQVFNGNDGIVVSPQHPAVVDRIDRLMDDLVEASFDLVFEDQVGAREGALDFNPASPYPAAYLDGWLAHARAHAGKYLGTEMGFDRLAEAMWGFFGSVLLFERRGDTDAWWGAGNWRVYPFTSMLAGDKALFYQHDLAPESATQSLANLTWNLAAGLMLNYDLLTGQLDAPEMLGVAGAFQRHAASLYAGERMRAFEEIGEGVTRSTFEGVAVVANRQSAAHTEGAHTLVPQGALVTSADGLLTAGVFSAFNGEPLSSGDHYLIVRQEETAGNASEALRVWQPLGEDTPLAVPRPAAWSDGDQIRVRAVGQADTVSVAHAVTDGSIRFTWSRTASGVTVDHYLLTHGGTATAVEERAAVPTAYALAPNYPNPFNPRTTIRFEVPQAGPVRLVVYDVLGREVAVLVEGMTPAGRHATVFDAGTLPSGVYVYRLEAGGRVLTRTMTVLK